MKKTILNGLKNNKITSFFKAINISYGITVCNEAIELNALLSNLIPALGSGDEIMVLQDITKKNQAVCDVLSLYKKDIRIIESKLNGDFATFKNNLISYAKGNYLFQIDADEILSPSLIKNIRAILKKRYKNDCFLIPRINIVNGYNASHVKKWDWSINDYNYINFPDYQPRIIKLNMGIKWVNKVHEVFVGYNRAYNLPADNYNLCITHVKNIEKQEKQNKFYEELM